MALWFGRDCEIQRLRGPHCEDGDSASHLHVNVIRLGAVHTPDPEIISSCKTFQVQLSPNYGKHILRTLKTQVHVL